MQKDNIKINGHVGTWYVIDEGYYYSEKVYLLEHEKYGDDASCIIVNKRLQVIKEGVCNGLQDLYN